MSFERQFVLASRGLAWIGVLSLATTREVGWIYVLLASGCLAWTVLRGWHGREQGFDGTVVNVTTVVAMALIFTPVFLRGAMPIRAIAEFLLVLMALRALAACTNRDWLQVYALSFFQLVAASALTVELVFAGLFFSYLLLAPWALVLFLLRREMTEVGQRQRLFSEPFVDPSLFRGVATVTLLLFVSTVLVFVFFPRMGAGFFANPLSKGSGLTGFSDEVGLGDVTALKADEAVAMRVTVDRPDRLRARPQYWRGAALDSFDGRRWRRGREELRPLSRGGPSTFLVNEQIPHRSMLREDIILEPMSSSMLFFLGTPRQIDGRFTAMLGDDLGNLRVLPSTGVRIRYDVIASLAPRTDPPTPRSRKLPALDKRVAELARSLVEGKPDDASKAEALIDHFRRGFRYTMEPGDPGERDPLAWFLFESKQGHCEYFASSLAVMLRTVGIPSLVVNGYLGGEWNAYGEYFVLRQSDAHSWVEAWVDGQWSTFDPTPASPLSASRARSGFAALLDSYRMRWYRYVINYSLEDQVGIALSLRNSSRRAWRGLSGAYWRTVWERLRRGNGARGSIPPWSLAVAGGLAVATALLWSRRRKRMAQRGVEWPTERYLEMLRLLERRGLRKRPADTADEFYRRVAPRLEADRARIERLTTLYQEARFSGRDLPDRRTEIDEILGSLERGA